MKGALSCFAIVDGEPFIYIYNGNIVMKHDLKKGIITTEQSFLPHALDNESVGIGLPLVLGGVIGTVIGSCVGK